MGIFSRLTDIINANINSMLDKAEDPEKVLRLIIQEMEETLVEVRSSAAKNLADKKGLLRQIRSLDNRIEFWREKASLALTKDREDLARSALVEKSKCEQQWESLQQELSLIEDNLSVIQGDSQQLQEKLNEAKRRKDSLVVRETSAVVRLKVREKLDRQNIESAIIKYEQYQHKIDDLEAKVEAYDFTKENDLAHQINQLENDSSIEQELAEMKQKVVNG